MMQFKSKLPLFVFLLQLAACAHTPPVSKHTDALEELKAGNTRFVKQGATHSRQDFERVKEQAKGQNPDAIIISCSDSRVPPEIVFDQGIGDIFSVRSAGQALGPYEIASVEYALEHFGTKIIVVMGHTSCGAVIAAAKTPVGKSAGSPSLDALVNQIRPNLGSYDSSDQELVQASKNNVEADARLLINQSPIIAHAVKEKKVEILHALYYLKTGEVEFW